MATASATDAKGKKGLSFSKIGNFLKSVWGELKKVHWPTKKEVITYTWVVLCVVAIFAVLIWVADSIFSFGITGLLNLAG